MLVVEGGDEHGVLYRYFALLRLIAEEHPLAVLNESSAPADSIRWTNEWDNPNGTIERGYGGPSIFFENGKVRADFRAPAHMPACSLGRHQRMHYQQRQRGRIDLLMLENIARTSRASPMCSVLMVCALAVRRHE